MKREDVKNKIPGITDDQLNWLMQENGAEINREKSAATALQTQLTAAAVLIHPLCPPENCAKQKVQRTFIR